MLIRIFRFSAPRQRGIQDGAGKFLVLKGDYKLDNSRSKEKTSDKIRLFRFLAQRQRGTRRMELLKGKTSFSLSRQRLRKLVELGTSAGEGAGRRDPMEMISFSLSRQRQ